MGTEKLALRKVALRDDLLVVGDKGTTHVFRDGLVMLGDHSTVNRRHWRAHASAFAILDPNGQPMVWIEGAHSNTMVVGETAAVVAKQRYLGRGPAELQTRGEHDQLKWFEVLKAGGEPVIRTWWAVGENVERTCRVARDEPLPSNWPARAWRFAELLVLMGLGGMD